jgi:hypothetical protein
MRLKMYKNADGGTEVLSLERAYDELRELGHSFAVSLAERGHDTKESDLMNGLAAYHLLDLTGVSARLDAAHKMVLRDITDVMLERARAALQE